MSRSYLPFIEKGRITINIIIAKPHNEEMKDKDFFVDFHTHPTLRAYNTPVLQGQRNLWEKTYNQTEDTAVSRLARLKTKSMLKESQANLYSYARGNSRVVVDSLYPVEKGFFDFRKMPVLMMGKEKADQVLRTITGIDPYQLKKLRNKRDYFQELLSHYAFLYRGQGKSPDGKFAYKLVGSYAEMERVLTEDPDTVAVVVSIEGGHVFNCGVTSGNVPKEADLRELVDNIGIVKSWEYPPFYINLAHHFYNELCGQARSLKPVFAAAFNQSRGLNDGITDLGWKVIHELLATDNGPRILIDIKHMSVRSRQEYYRFIQAYNRLNPGDKIPILCSHTGINNFETMEASVARKDTGGKNKKTDFHNWQINLANDEIRIIHESGGLIGIMLDKGILGSASYIDLVSKMEDEEARKEAYVRMIARNIFGVIQAIGDRSAWDSIVLGSDFDGVITYIDPYPDASTLPDLKRDLVNFIEKYKYEQGLWFGMEPEELIQKMFQHNTLAFMKKHFHGKSKKVVPESPKVQTTQPSNI